MAIPDSKRPELETMLGGAEGLERFEAELTDKAKELLELDIEHKDESPVEEVAQEAEEVEEVEAEAEPKEAAEESPAYVTEDQMVEVFGTYLKPLVDQMVALAGTVEEQGKELKELRKSDDEKLKDTLADTPAASLFDRIGSAIGEPETYVDGRTKLAKAGPKETEDDVQGPTHVPILNEYMSLARGQ